MIHRTGRTLRCVLLLLVVTVSGCIVESPPNRVAYPAPEPLQMGPDVSEVQRIVEVSFPAGAFQGAYESGAELEVGSGGAAFVPTEFRLGDPFNATILIEDMSVTTGYPLEWEIPECGSGCVVTVPVTIREIEEGGETRVTWTIRFWYYTDGPPAVDRDDITAVIIDPEADDEDG